MAFSTANYKRFYEVNMSCAPPPGTYNPIYPGDNKLIKQELPPRKNKYKELFPDKRAKNRLDVLATPHKY